MRMSDDPFAPSDRMVRQFAGLWVLIFGGVACRTFQSGHPFGALTLAVLALTVGPLGLVRPGAVRPVYVGWMRLTYPIGWAVSRLLLAGLFYGLFTPMALLFRVTGRDVLCRRPQVGKTTYWSAKATAPDPARYLRQF